MLPDLKHCQGEKKSFFSCDNTTWTLEKNKKINSKVNKIYMSIEAGISLFKTPCVLEFFSSKLLVMCPLDMLENFCWCVLGIQ
jgi:hypothetical protein